MASEIAQNRLRQAITSPSIAWLPRKVLARIRDTEELMGEGTRAGIGRADQHVLLLRVVQRVIESRNGARGVAERRMRGDILDPFAV